MEQKDAQIIKILSELGLRQDTSLSEEEKDMLNVALDPEKQYLEDVERLFTKK